MKKLLVGIVTLLAAVVLSSPAFGALYWDVPDTYGGGQFTFDVELIEPVNLAVTGSEPGFDALPDTWGATKPLITPDSFDIGSTTGTAYFNPGVEIVVAQWNGYQYGFLFEGYVTEFAWTDLRYAMSHVDGYNANPVPVPAAVWLLGSGVLGLVAIRRRRS